MEKQLTFENRISFKKWLTVNHDSHEAVWLVFGKSGKLKTLSPDETLQEAICFGWIDGLIKRVDDTCYVKRFSHRNESSQWSQRNKDFVKTLIANKQMTEFGLEEIERAKKNGKWLIAERQPVTQEEIDTLIKLLVVLN